MANQGRSKHYTGPDSEQFRLASNDDPGTKEQRQAWKRAIAQEQEDTKAALAQGYTLDDLGIRDVKEEGRARFNFFGGEEGAKREGQAYGRHQAENNVKYGHWLRNPNGPGYLDFNTEADKAAGNVRATYDPYGAKTSGGGPMGPYGGGGFGGYGGGFGGPQMQYGPVDYSGFGGFGGSPYGSSTGIGGSSQIPNSFSVSTPVATTQQMAAQPYRRTGAGGGRPGRVGGGTPLGGFGAGNNVYNNPAMGLPGGVTTGGVKPVRNNVGQSVPQSSWGG